MACIKNCLFLGILFVLANFDKVASKNPPIRQDYFKSNDYKSIVYSNIRDYILVHAACEAEDKYSYFSPTTGGCESCSDLCPLSSTTPECVAVCPSYLNDLKQNKTIASLLGRIQNLESTRTAQWILIAVMFFILVAGLIYILWKFKKHEKHCEEIYHRKDHHENSHDRAGERERQLMRETPPYTAQERSPRSDRAFNDNRDSAFSSTTSGMDASQRLVDEPV